MFSELRIRFEWDLQEEKINISKHKLNFTDASYVFSDVFQLNLFDDEHSDDEERWIVIGEIPSMKIVVVVHTFKESNNDNDTLVRILFARKATKKELATYLMRRQR